MRFVFVLLIMLSTIHLRAQNKPQIIYVGDAMCSWCYGFAPQITKVKEHYASTLDFKLINGGLRPYNTESIVSLSDFLKEHWQEIEKRTGQKFNFDILKKADFIYDTEPAARAVMACRELNPEKEFIFFKAVQELFYFQNKETNKVESYKALVEQFNINYDAFVKLFNSDELKQKTKQDFMLSSSLGVSGFPTVLIKKDEKYILVSNGYATSENIIKTIDKILKQ